MHRERCRALPTTTRNITLLLQDAAAGKPEAVDALIPLVYDQLRRIAQQRIAHRREGFTPQATELVPEALIKLALTGGRLHSPASMTHASQDSESRSRCLAALQDLPRCDSELECADWICSCVPVPVRPTSPALDASAGPVQMRVPARLSRAGCFLFCTYGLVVHPLALLLHTGRYRTLSFRAAPLVHGHPVLEELEESTAPQGYHGAIAVRHRAVAHLQ